MRPFDLFFQLNPRIDGRTNSPTFLYRCNSTFLWCSWAFLMTYMKKNLHFCNLKKTHYGPTDGPTDRRTDQRTDRRTNGRTDWRMDGPTDGPTDGRTDRLSYRDARTHLKKGEKIEFPNQGPIYHVEYYEIWVVFSYLFTRPLSHISTIHFCFNF